MSFKSLVPYTTCIKLLVLSLFLTVFYNLTGSEAIAATLYHSVEKAMLNDPKLQALKHRRQAIEYDLEQSISRWKPIVDLTLGYGIDQHSDRTTRGAGADPDDTDWDERENATIKLTQKLYDGGETSSKIAIEEAKLNSAEYDLKAAIQAVGINAVKAHLNVLRQRKLVALSEKNLEAHQQIYKLLEEREQAGAGSIADVSQVRARMARAESILALTRANLVQATANYTRVTGVPAQMLDYAGIPDSLPQTLDETLKLAEEKNPELMALDAEIVAADSKLSLARSKYKPKLDLELSSSYNNNLEGEPSWESTNTAMFSMRWNLFNGGHDKAGIGSARSRRNQTRSQRNAKWAELKETISADWGSHLAIQTQKKAFRDAVKYSRKTFNAYLNQFSVSQRTLLDVLIAENDFYQSATQLVNIYMDGTITAYRLLASMGSLKVPECSRSCKDHDAFKELNLLIKFPYNKELLSTPDTTFNLADEPYVTSVENKTAAETAVIETVSKTHTIEIGPFVNLHELNKAKEELEGYQIEEKSGSGPVTMLRFFIGAYPKTEAMLQLTELKKKINSGFVLSHKKGLGVYAGSFRPCHRADSFREKLQQKEVNFTEIPSLVKLKGKILVVDLIDKDAAEKIVEQMSEMHVSTKVIVN